MALDEIVRILNAERALPVPLPGGTGDLELLLAHAMPEGIDMPISSGYSTTLVERVRTSREALVITGTDEGAALGSGECCASRAAQHPGGAGAARGPAAGVVYLDSRLAKGMFTEDDVDILVAITNHVAVSLETARAAQLEVTIQSPSASAVHWPRRCGTRWPR